MMALMTPVRTAPFIKLGFSDVYIVSGKKLNYGMKTYNDPE